LPSMSAPVMGATSGMGFNLNLNIHLNLIGKKGSSGQECVIRLVGDESKPSSPVPSAMLSLPLGPGMVMAGPPLATPPSLVWHALMGWHDLSHRQLVLLPKMLHKADLASSLNLHTDNLWPAGGPSILEEWLQLNMSMNGNV
jgi:hypothetical protein